MRGFRGRNEQLLGNRLRRHRRYHRYNQAGRPAGDRLLSAGEERSEPPNAVVVVPIFESSRSPGGMMGIGMMGFVMAMNDNRIIAMMIGGLRMDVLGGQRCQDGEAQSRDRRRQSA